MAVDYRKLDALILDFISGSCSSPLYDSHCQEEAKRLEQQHGGEDFRYIDRRLQALRKMGVIVYLKKADAPAGKTGWYLALSELAE